jgi:hypothetical protein
VLSYYQGYVLVVVAKGLRAMWNDDDSEALDWSKVEEFLDAVKAVVQEHRGGWRVGDARTRSMDQVEATAVALFKAMLRGDADDAEALLDEGTLQLADLLRWLYEPGKEEP